MFNSLFTEEASHNNQEKNEGAASTSNAEASTTGTANPLLNLWSVATAVTNTVKARADELVKSVVDTDWRSELSQFSREVGEESKTLKEKTAELVEHLPDQVVHLPEKAEEALHHLPTQVPLPKDVGQTLEGVSSAFAQFGKSLLLGTKELIDELKEGVETEIAAASREGKRSARSKTAAASASKMSAVPAKYNRFEAEVAGMQRDSSTYCDEPEDAEDYGRWKAGFSLEGVKAEISRITAENAFMAELQSRLVPIIVEHDDFWRRYFYRLHKLQQKEEQRQQLAQRAKTLQEDEVPLGWGDEDEAPPASSLGAAEPASGAPVEAQVPLSAPASAPAEAPAAEQAAESVAEPAGQYVAASPKGAAAAAAPVSSSVSPSAEPTAAAALTAAAVPAAALAGTVAIAAAAPAVSAAEADAEASASVELVPSGTASKAQSGGGASEPGSASAHLDVDPSQLESEPHAETASDSSTKEWCVVSSDAAKASMSGDVAGATVAALVASQASAEAAEPALVAVSAPAAETSSPMDVPEAGGSGASLPAATKAVAAVPSAKGTGAGGPTKGGDDEEVDEDWGNWD